MLSQELLAAFKPLLPQPNFSEWAEGIHANRERTIGEFGSFQTIADKRVVAVTVAELGVYDDIVALYEESHPGWVESLDELKVAEHEVRLREAMSNLILDFNFVSLMGAFRRAANGELATIREAKNETAQLAAIGCLNAYRSIWDSYRAYLQPVEHGIREERRDTA